MLFRSRSKRNFLFKRASFSNIYDELAVACVKIREEFSDRWIFQHPENGNCVMINNILSNKNGHTIAVAQVHGNAQVNDLTLVVPELPRLARCTRMKKTKPPDGCTLNIPAFFRHKVTIILVMIILL